MKYALDTNLFIAGMRSTEDAAELAEFHNRFAPFEYLSAVVVQELTAGAPSREVARRLDHAVVDPFRRRGRLVTPSFTAWASSGAVLSVMARRHHVDLRRISKSKANDILLAVSCREAGITVITQNRADFEAINSITPIDFMLGWPSL